MENIEKINRLINRLYNATLNNYDELLDELEDPAISLVLVGFDDMPSNVSNLPDDAFVDELFGYYDDVKKGGGLYLCFAHIVDDETSERCDEMPVEELDEDYLEKLVDFAEKHIPIKVIKC